MKKIISIFVIMILIISLRIINTYAAYTCTINMNTSNSTAEVGKEISIIVSAKNINMENGIVGMSACLNYDESIFELISVTSGENFEIVKNLETTIFGKAKDFIPINTPQDFFSINFKVKDSATTGDYEIGLSNIELVTDGGTLFAITEKKLPITVKEANNQSEDPTQEDPKQDDPTQEDPKQEDPKQEDPTQEDPKQDDPTQEDPKQDEPTQEDPKQDDPTQEDTKQEDTKQEDSKQEETKQDSQKQNDTTQKNTKQDLEYDEEEYDDEEYDDEEYDDEENNNKQKYILNYVLDNNTISSKTTSDKSLPYAGTTTMIIIIGSVIILAVVSFIKYKKYRSIK